MSEVVDKKVELTVEEQKAFLTEKLKLNAVELGGEYECTVEKKGHRFTLKVPTISEDFKIATKVQELRKELGLETTVLSISEEFPLRVIATLSYVVIKAQRKKKIKEGEYEWETLTGSFWDMVKNIVSTKSVYDTLIYPLYDDFNTFRQYIDISLDEVKK